MPSFRNLNAKESYIMLPDDETKTEETPATPSPEPIATSPAPLTPDPSPIPPTAPEPSPTAPEPSPAVTPAAPPVDNAHVADGAEKFAPNPGRSEDNLPQPGPAVGTPGESAPSRYGKE